MVSSQYFDAYGNLREEYGINSRYSREVSDRLIIALSRVDVGVLIKETSALFDRKRDLIKALIFLLKKTHTIREAEEYFKLLEIQVTCDVRSVTTSANEKYRHAIYLGSFFDLILKAIAYRKGKYKTVI